MILFITNIIIFIANMIANIIFIANMILFSPEFWTIIIFGFFFVFMREREYRPNLEILFEEVKTGVSILRRKNPNMDGQKFWQIIKNALKVFDIYIASGWEPINKELKNMILALPEFDKNGNIIELNHFIIQQVRIPETEKATICKIVQIALNMGQYDASGSDPMFYTIYDFVSYNDVNKLSEYIPNQLIDGVRDYIRNYK